jgi:hypothetical protein
MAMPTNSFSEGDVIIYPYRWAEELAQGRSIDGAKDRPCCLVVSAVNAQNHTVIFLAAISSKPPRADQKAIAIPEMERRRAGLEKYPEAWVYVDELNSDQPGSSWYLEPQTPLGTFGRAFLIKVAVAVRQHARASRIVSRK